MRRFRIAIFAGMLLSHVPFAVGLAFALELLAAPFAQRIALAVTALILLGLRSRLTSSHTDRPVGAWRLLFVEEPCYAHLCATVAAWPLFIVTGIAGAVLHEEVGAAALASYLGALALCLYGVVVRRRWVRVRSIDVPIAGLGAAFDGYRIAQLSDLHIGGLWPRARALRWVSRVNALDVDLVALTGDYVTHGTSFHDDIAAVLAAMRSRDGTVAVMGNHDYSGDGESLATLLGDRGVAMLRNEHRILWRAGDSVTVVGVDDSWSRRADVARALAGHDGKRPLIALAHDPQMFPELARRGAALVLSGHTHWGQIALPFLATRYNLSRLSYRYHAGLYREGAAALYVSPGLGTTGPPIRLGAPPEITVLRLRAAPRD